MKIFFTATVLLFVIACNNNDKPVSDDSSTTTTLPAPQPITFTVDSVYPHDPKAFTQGLQFYNGKLYEGTGLNEESSLRIVDPKSGKVEKKYVIQDTSIFGEGITIFNNKIYQLTWTSHKIFEYNLSDITQPIKTFNWSREGWGITNDGKNLIISDGSDKLFYVQPDETKNQMSQIKILSVADNTGALDNLNELEFINGYIFANRWQTDDILKIDTANGHVVGKMNMTGLLQQYDSKEITNDTNVLNGIAYDSATKKLFITGKNWPKMFEIRLNN